MATMHINYFSNSLRRLVNMIVIIPDRPVTDDKGKAIKHYSGLKTLYLLHGYYGNQTDWLYQTRISELAQKYQLAVIMPAGENSFYLDDSIKGEYYSDFVGSELVHYTRQIFHLSTKAEDTFIGGLSMGGFGAIINGVKYPNHFSKIVGLSPAMIIHLVAEGMRDNGMAPLTYYRHVFGESESLLDSDKNPETLLKRMVKAGIEIPDMFIACGKDDFLIDTNREFIDFLKAQGIAHTFHEVPGVHDWDFWNHWLEPSIKWLLDK